MMNPIGVSNNNDAAMFADMERLQEDGKIKQQKVSEPHDLVITQQEQNISVLQSESNKVGGFGMFQFILQMFAAISSIVGDFFSPMAKQISKVISSGEDFATRIYSFIDFVNKQKKSSQAQTLEGK